ncbi:hypothetical protein ACRALDRAFT_208169 [Sodiomyces alcalophilus JCM 7366]|uniref:uncharacterized protein n=1 Tax=Sodiomyces alcalophilus JCM 7366 TaxID=591952 RepID=UPI0039B3C74A
MVTLTWDPAHAEPLQQGSSERERKGLCLPSRAVPMYIPTTYVVACVTVAQMSRPPSDEPTSPPTSHTLHTLIQPRLSGRSAGPSAGHLKQPQQSLKPPTPSCRHSRDLLLGRSEVCRGEDDAMPELPGFPRLQFISAMALSPSLSSLLPTHVFLGPSPETNIPIGIYSAEVVICLRLWSRLRWRQAGGFFLGFPHSNKRDSTQHTAYKCTSYLQRIYVVYCLALDRDFGNLSSLYEEWKDITLWTQGLGPQRAHTAAASLDMRHATQSIGLCNPRGPVTVSLVLCCRPHPHIILGNGDGGRDGTKPCGDLARLCRRRCQGMAANLLVHANSTTFTLVAKGPRLRKVGRLDIALNTKVTDQDRQSIPTGRGRRQDSAASLEISVAACFRHETAASVWISLDEATGKGTTAVIHSPSRTHGRGSLGHASQGTRSKVPSHMRRRGAVQDDSACFCSFDAGNQPRSVQQFLTWTQNEYTGNPVPPHHNYSHKAARLATAIIDAIRPIHTLCKLTADGHFPPLWFSHFFLLSSLSLSLFGLDRASVSSRTHMEIN